MIAPLLAMAGTGAAAWAVVVAVAPGLNPEALLGIVGPLASALVTWIVVARAVRVTEGAATASASIRPRCSPSRITTSGRSTTCGAVRSTSYVTCE